MSKHVIVAFNSKEEAEHAVACVNACKGIADPETTVPELGVALKDALGMLDPFQFSRSDREEYDRLKAVLAKLEGGAK